MAMAISISRERGGDGGVSRNGSSKGCGTGGVCSDGRVKVLDFGLARTAGGAPGVTDPGLVVRSVTGEVRQPFALVFHARAVGGVPRGDLHETSEAAWIAPAELPGLPMEPSTRLWIEQALAVGAAPRLA